MRLGFQDRNVPDLHVLPTWKVLGTCDRIKDNLEGARFAMKAGPHRGSFVSRLYIMGTHKYAESILKSLFLISIVVMHSGLVPFLT